MLYYEKFGNCVLCSSSVIILTINVNLLISGCNVNDVKYELCKRC